MEWFRWYSGSVFDPKFKIVARRSGVSIPVVISVWAAVLEQACVNHAKGDFRGLDAESVDAGLDLEDGTTIKVLQALESKDMVSNFVVLAWEKRQPARERNDDSSERVKAFRERKRLTTPVDGIEKTDVTPCNAIVTPCNAQIDREIERERDRERARERDRDDDEPNQNSTTEPVTPKRTGSNDDDFDAFWKAYPRKLGKGAAKKAWDKLAKAKALPDVATLIAAVKAAKASDQWSKDDGQFIPHPATWLNQARWEDEHDVEPEWVQPVATQEEIDRIQARRQEQRDRELEEAIKRHGPVRYGDPRALDLFAPPPEMQTKRH